MNEDSPDSGSVTLLSYSGIVQDNYEEAVVDPFRDEYPDIDVEFVPGDNAASMLGTLRSEAGSPSNDVVIMDSAISETGHHEGLFVDLDENDVPNIAGLVEEGETPGGPAVMFDSFVLLHDLAEYPVAPESWEALWDAPQSSLVIDAAPDIQGQALTRIVAEMEGADYQDDIQPAIDRLRDLDPLVQSWSPNPSPYQAITDGSAVMGVGWNARGQTFADESPDALGVATPEEGTLFQINTVNLTEGTENPEAAKTFIDYALSPEAQASFTEQMYYTPTVEDVSLSPETEERITDADSDALLEFDWSWMSENQDEWTNLWSREIL